MWTKPGIWSLLCRVQAIARNHMFFDCKMKLKISFSPLLLPPACLLLKDHFTNPSSSFLLLHKAARPAQPEAHRQKTPPPFLAHWLLISLARSTAHSHRTHHGLVLRKCSLQSHPVPSNNSGTWSISGICPQSSSSWGNLMLLKSLRPSTPSMTQSLPGPLGGLFNEVTNPLSPFDFLSFLLLI